MRTFKIKVSIQFLVSSAGFEHHVFIIRKTICTCNYVCFSFIYVRSIKGKAVPLQAWSGPEGSEMLRFPDFMTTAQGGGKFVSLTHRPPLTPGNTSVTHFC